MHYQSIHLLIPHEWPCFIYLSQMDKKVLKSRAKHFEKVFPNTWMHQPESQKRQEQFKLSDSKKVPCLSRVLSLALQSQLVAALEPCLWWPHWQHEVCKMAFSSLTWLVLKHASSERGVQEQGATHCDEDSQMSDVTCPSMGNLLFGERS